MKPARIQLRRQRGFRLQAVSHALNGLPCVKVDRSTKWGNPWLAGSPAWVWLAPGEGLALPMRITAAGAVDRFRRWLLGEFKVSHGHPIYEAVIAPHREPPDPHELRGFNLACWCRPDAEACHADVLLKLANAEPNPPRSGGTC